MHHPWQKKLIKLQAIILQAINAPYSIPRRHPPCICYNVAFAHVLNVISADQMYVKN